jgi:tetratricopeptide (TPR) repeat protein
VSKSDSARGCRRVALLAMGGALAILAAAFGGWWWWQAREAEQLAAQQKAAEEAFEPAREAMGKAGAEAIDIDRTVRVLHQIDESMRHQDDLHDFLASVAKEDWRGVPKEVLDARQRILDVELELYGKQVEAEQQEAMWSLSRDIVLTTLSVVSVKGEGGLTPDASFELDREAAEDRLEEIRKEEAERRKLVREIDTLEGKLISASMDYATVWAKYMERYDRLCLRRDRAWLASRRGDWDEVEREARGAVEMAPNDVEAHLLLARALLEKGDPERRAEALGLLDDAMARHPDAAAPAMLLRGLSRERSGDLAGAMADYEQSSELFPSQAEKLDDVLDPYRQRAELRKSRAGAGIVESYAATMVGAGYFSPELHLARLAYARGDREAGKRKVIEHFERRRAQGQWDYILADLDWSESVLGDDFRAIFPEEPWLDLHAEKTFFGLGQKLAVSVDNRSQRTLKNAALVLCVRFTDMLTGDYVTFPGERTAPEVPARQSTDFGKIDIDTEVFRKPRTEDDIVDMRAILVTDDGVLWVDTEKYKDERLAEAKAEPPTEDRRWSRIADEAGRSAKVSRDNGVIDDALEIELPAQMVWLRPKFTLHYGESVISADSNVIEGDRIKLRFKGLTSVLAKAALEPEAPPQAANLVCESVFGTFTLDFAPGPGGGWEYLGMRAE